MSVRPIKFALVGVSNTVINYAVFVLALRGGLHVHLALALAYFVAIINSYVWNRRWTFRSVGSPVRELPKFVAVYLVVYLVNAALLQAFIHEGHLPPAVAQALCLIITTGLSYGGQRLWTFRPMEAPEAP